MALAKVDVEIDGTDKETLSIAYDIVGDSGPTWALTPGGRFRRSYPGVRETAEAIAALGNRVLIYDRPNTGESDVCFTGSTESAMQADALAALIAHLDLSPAVIIGGSGGARVSLLTAARHPDITRGLGVWMMSGGVYGLLTVGTGYCSASIGAVWNGGMEAVLAIPATTQGNWHENVELNPSAREKIPSQDPRTFRETMQRWLQAYCPTGDDLVPGLSLDDARQMKVPTLVFRSGESDMFHTRVTSERLADVLPNAEILDPPWGDREWVDSKLGQRFVNWPRVAPILNDWAIKTLP